MLGVWCWALWCIYMGFWWGGGGDLRVNNGLEDVLMRDVNSNLTGVASWTFEIPPLYDEIYGCMDD